ncbi:unnamed protein product [Brassica rapa subsp. narinosa]
MNLGLDVDELEVVALDLTFFYLFMVASVAERKL